MLDSADATADTLNLTATKVCPKYGSTMGYFVVDTDCIQATTPLLGLLL